MIRPVMIRVKDAVRAATHRGLRQRPRPKNQAIRAYVEELDYMSPGAVLSSNWIH